MISIPRHGDRHAPNYLSRHDSKFHVPNALQLQSTPSWGRVAGVVRRFCACFEPFQYPTNMNRITSLLLLGVAVCLAACSTTSPRVIATSIVPGMTSAELRSAFGPPLRTERKPDGSEDWFYNFGTQDWESRPFSETVGSQRERSYSVGHTTTTTTTMTPLPIHLSPEGRVVGEIPAGSVIVE